jgi:hypothetical protein
MPGPRARTSDPGERLKDTATDVVGRATDTAGRAVGTTVETNLDRAADVLAGFASAMQRAGTEMRDEQPAAAGWIEGAADQVSRASSFLRENDMESIVAEVEGFARRQPALFIGGALVVGAFAGRFLRASPGGQRRSGWYRQGERRPAGAYGSRAFDGPYRYTPELPSRSSDRTPVGSYGSSAGTSGTGQTGGALGRSFSGSEPDAGA